MNKVFKECAIIFNETHDKEQTDKIISSAEEIYNKICEENSSEPKEVKMHTINNIYPCISLYKAMQQQGIDSSSALKELDYCWSKRAEKGASQIKSMLKLPGLYKLYPLMFKSVAKNQFGTKAGFEAKFYDTEKTRVKFDMTKCLFCDVCKKYDCFELVVCFCHTDDVNNGNLHKNLCWNRTQIMGDGKDYCDFDLFVKNKENK